MTGARNLERSQDDAPGDTPTVTVTPIAGSPAAAPRVARDAISPQPFSTASASPYLADDAIRKLVAFFEAKGLGVLKEEDRREQWYDDWLAYQAEHRLYASLLSPNRYSSRGGELDLLRLTRFLEVFGYFSPAHGYSLQVTFLGLFAVLIGSNDALKREAVATLEAGGLLAFGVSEKRHGSDLLGNGFTVNEAGDGRLVANGGKYYIGNANCASLITILAKKETAETAARGRRRAPLVLVVLRPNQSTGLRNVRKISTLGVRAGFVGKFEVKDYELTDGDVVAEGRDAWEAVFGAVTLGKFFLGFGSIGICEHAFEEAAAHLRGRVLYGRRVIDLPHIRSAVAQAYARLTAMKLFAYRALDYVHAATARDRRYLMFNAVQKARVSTEGVKVTALLSECINAKGFEADTYFEMALRDILLIPGLEGSTHINLGLTAQFAPQYFRGSDVGPAEPKSLIAAGASGAAAGAGENAYLMEARTGAVHTIEFPHFLTAYQPLRDVANVRLFARQAEAFSTFARAGRSPSGGAADPQVALAMGQCLATIAYGQLVAENAVLQDVAPQLVSVIFHLLVLDLAAAATALAAIPQVHPRDRFLLRRAMKVPRTSAADWDVVADRVAGGAPERAGG